jgi:DNA (cytosine-5)-methyltransferase 1
MDILRVGTDCSGIEAPIQALLQMKIPFKHIFSSDIDKYCIKSIKANYNPEIIFGDKNSTYPVGDITERNINNVPDIDLYVCGFPCQPFSMAGERKGFSDKRGIVFFSCLEVIEKKQPSYFILENVKGLLSHDKGNTWKVICDEMVKLRNYGYTIKWKILNTKDYGIPQNRERIFIVGCRNKDFEWPEKKIMDDLKNYIDNDDNVHRNIPQCCKQLLDIIPNDAIFIDIGYRHHKHVNSDKYSPSLTCNNRLWNVKKSRYSNTKERLQLQGFDLNFKQVISKTQMDKQIGNSMSVNVVKCLLEQILK